MGRLVVDVRPIGQVRFPKSRKRRIRKKWAKRASNWMLLITFQEVDGTYSAALYTSGKPVATTPIAM